MFSELLRYKHITQQWGEALLLPEPYEEPRNVGGGKIDSFVNPAARVPASTRAFIGFESRLRRSPLYFGADGRRIGLSDTDMVETLTSEDLKTLIGKLSALMSEHAEELTALDAAIGDGDHGHNMKRGFEALVAEGDVISAKPLGEALKAAGMKLVMTVGGASGPLFGTLLMTLGKEIGENPDRASLNAAFRKAVDSVAARGKSEKGRKTMLDVLYPLADALEAGVESGGLIDIANQAAEATVPVVATRGRASFLGERSAGHMDPGSRSVALLAAAIANFMENRR